MHYVISYRLVANAWIARNNMQSCAARIINSIQIGSFFVKFFQERKISLQKCKKGKNKEELIKKVVKVNLRNLWRS